APPRAGWGITLYEGTGCRTFKDPMPSYQSRIAQLVQEYPIKSCAVVSHIRQANRGAVALENTHPFTRELWGRYWTFAHNGQLSGYESWPTGRFLPVGTTDSEQAFCWLLNELELAFPTSPEPRLVFARIAACADWLATHGVFNMLLTDGEQVMTYCSSQLHWLTRRAPFGQARLLDEDVSVDFQQETTPNDVVSLIATLPLTQNEQWHKMAQGECNLFVAGERVLWRPAGESALAGPWAP
ncbi:MAG: class II glutamine amidotransferase, partial [Aeromonadaceae bacterium]